PICDVHEVLDGIVERDPPGRGEIIEHNIGPHPHGQGTDLARQLHRPCATLGRHPQGLRRLPSSPLVSPRGRPQSPLHPCPRTTSAARPVTAPSPDAPWPRTDETRSPARPALSRPRPVAGGPTPARIAHRRRPWTSSGMRLPLPPHPGPTPACSAAGGARLSH